MTRLAWCSRCDASHVSCAICHKSHLTCYDSPLESHVTCYHSPLTISALLARAREKGRPTLRSGRKSAPTVGTCCYTHVCHVVTPMYVIVTPMYVNPLAQHVQQVQGVQDVNTRLQDVKTRLLMAMMTDCLCCPAILRPRVSVMYV